MCVVDLRLERVDPRVDGVLLDLQRSDLGVPGRDGGVGGGQLGGEPVAFRRRGGPAAGQLGEPLVEVLPLAVDRLVGGLQRRVLVGDLLQFVQASNFGLERAGSTSMPRDVLLGLLEQLLVAFEHAALLAVRLEEFGQVLPQPGLGGVGFRELGLQRTLVRGGVGSPARRTRR